MALKKDYCLYKEMLMLRAGIRLSGADMIIGGQVTQTNS